MNFVFSLKFTTFIFLVKKEFKQFFRDKFMPKLLVGFPVVAILVIPWVANMEIKQVKISLIDWDKSTTTKELSKKIESNGYFISSQNTFYKGDSTYNFKHCIFSGECDIIVEFPNNFEREFIANHFANLAIYANAINSVKGTLGSGYLSNIIASFGVETIRDSAILSLKSQNTLKNIDILPIFVFNPHLDYKLYMIPALMVMVLTMLCGFLPAFNIITEKQNGNLEQINVTPLPKAMFIISKIIPYWLMGLFVISVCFLLAFVVYGFSSKGGYASIYIVAIAYIFVVTGLGLVISNYSNTMQQAMFVAYFFILILLLLSGLFTSVKSMPFWAEIITYFNPLRYFIEALRAIFLKGENLANSIFLWYQLGALLGFALIFNIWAIMGYKKRS